MTAAKAANEKKAPQRSKRLRKKLFQDEFATFGFELECEFKSDLTDETISQFVDSFFIDAINAENLAFGGGLSSKRLSGFVGSNIANVFLVLGLPAGERAFLGLGQGRVSWDCCDSLSTSESECSDSACSASASLLM